MSLRRKATNAGKWSGFASIGVIAIQVLQIYLLSRMLTEEDFGLYALLMVVIQIVRQFSDMGIGAAIVQREDPTHQELSSLYWLNVFFGGLLCAVISASAKGLAWFFEDTRLSSMFMLASVTVFVAGFGQQYQYLLQKELRFRSLAVVDLSGSALGAIFAVFSASHGAGAFAFVYGMLLSQGLRTGMLLIYGLRIHCPLIRFKREELRGYLRFGMFLSGQNIVNLLSSRMDSLIIGKILGPAPLGLYFFAQQFTSQIYLRITPILSRVAFPVFSKVQGDPIRMQQGYLKMVQILALVIFPILAGLAVLANEFLAVFFDPKWQSAAILIQILAIVALLKSVISPVGVLLMARGRTDIGFYMNVYILVQVTGLMILGANFGVVGVALGVLASTLIACSIWIIVQQRLFDIRVNSLFKVLWKPVLSMVLLVIVTLSTKIVAGHFNVDSKALLLLSSVFGGSIYLFCIYFVFLSEFRRFIKFRPICN
jgi:O-antigen/teichoic acid export membrane protein